MTRVLVCAVAAVVVGLVAGFVTFVVLCALGAAFEPPDLATEDA